MRLASGPPRWCQVVAGLLAPVLLLVLPTPAAAGVLMQAFYWDAEAPAGESWWVYLARRASELASSGFTAVWLPPVLKGASGGYSMGYDPFDDYDIGSKDQRGTVATRWGTREELQRAVAVLRANGLDVYLDMVLNHRNGDGGDWVFHYKDAYGVMGDGTLQGGRFPKDYDDFHPGCGWPQDQHVPNEDSSFGRDLCHDKPYVAEGLKAAGDWLTQALDVQGYRLDYVKGISYTFLLDWLNYGAMAGKFAVGEYWDTNRDVLNWWVSTAMQGRAHAFDFALREKLKAMSNSNGWFNMAELDHAGLVGVNPLRAVTFCENHDTDRHDPIVINKHLCYAYILTAEGYPTVFWRDYFDYGMKPIIDKLIWIHEHIAGGPTQERWKDGDIFAFERLGQQVGRPNLLVAINDNQQVDRTITVQTSFGPVVRLRDYSGHAPDVTTDVTGQATITVPRNGYVAYSVAGLTGGFSPPEYPVTQEFAGAPDLDIPPAGATAPVTAGRVYAAGGRTVRAGLYFETQHWTAATRLRLQALDSTGVVVASSDFGAVDQGKMVTFIPSSTGWLTWRIQALNAPPENVRPSYRLKVTYTAPRTLVESDPAMGFRPEVSISAGPNPASTGVTFFLPPLWAGGTLYVYDVAGRLVYRAWVGPEQETHWWPLTDSAGRPVASGLYLYVAVVEGGLRTPVGRLVVQR